MNTTLNYSPNFDKKKRRPEEIKFIIFHYTGMKKEENSIDRLTSNKSTEKDTTTKFMPPVCYWDPRM